jgi:hypothetical protein
MASTSSLPRIGYDKAKPPGGSSISGSDLWHKAINKVEKTPEWQPFRSIVDAQRDAVAVSTGALDGRQAAKDLPEMLSAKVASLVTKRDNHRKRHELFYSICEKVLSTLCAAKDAGAAAAAFNPYAALGK